MKLVQVHSIDTAKPWEISAKAGNVIVPVT